MQAPTNSQRDTLGGERRRAILTPTYSAWGGDGGGGGESHITPHLVRRLGSKAGVREEERSGTQEHLKSLPPAQRYAPGGHLYAVKNSGGNEVRGVVSVLYEAAA